MRNTDSTGMTAAPAANLKAFFRCLEHAAGVETRSVDGRYFYYSGVPHPWFNGVILRRPPGAQESELLQEIGDFFAPRPVRSHSLWLEEDAWLETWASHVEPAGFQLNQDTPGMSADLADLPESVPTPAGFSIQRVADEHTLQSWTAVFTKGFGLPDAFTWPYHRLMLALGFERPLRHYLGLQDGKPVATASLFLQNGIAGIYNVATLPQARGQGLGSAVTLEPLLEARRMGIQIGALQSSELGFRVYQRLGFRKVADVAFFSRKG